MIRRTRSLGRSIVPLRGAVMTVVLGSAACAGEPRSAADSTKPAGAAPSVATANETGSAAASAPATTTASGPACVSEGQWQECSVEKRLSDAGFVPIRKSTAPSGIFAVEGTTYALGRAELHVYVFPSSKARERALADIDTVTVARRPGPPPSWPAPPSLISSNNLVAILVSDNGQTIERVQNAIRAGLPAASR